MSMGGKAVGQFVFCMGMLCGMMCLIWMLLLSMRKRIWRVKIIGLGFVAWVDIMVFDSVEFLDFDYFSLIDAQINLSR